MNVAFPMSGQGRPPQRDVFGAQCTARLCFGERFAGQVARSTASLESQGDWLGLTLYDSCIRDLSPAYAVAPCPRFFSRDLPITWSTSCNPSAPGSSGRVRGDLFSRQKPLQKRLCHPRLVLRPNETLELQVPCVWQVVAKAVRCDPKIWLEKGTTHLARQQTPR